MLNLIKKSMVVMMAFSTFGAGSVGTSSAAMAQARTQAAASSNLPEALKRAAIATRSDKTGSIAGAQIGNTSYYVVYIKTARGCGSGGCRAQIWKRQGSQYIRGETLPVGYMPIVIVAPSANGMPLLGITVFSKSLNRRAILPIAFNGQSYSNYSFDRLLPANSGKPLLTPQSLRAF